VEDNGDGTFDVLRGDGGQYQGTFESREDAEQAANALEDDGDQAQDRRRWTVCPGTDGRGGPLFEVYATTMAEARESVIKSAEESQSPAIQLMVGTLGFTVHAEAAGRWFPGTNTLAGNLFLQNVPAPDLELEPATI
jgi:hypothetical protein